MEGVVSELQEASLTTESKDVANVNTNSAVSHVVLFEDRKPVCVADAVGRPGLVPPFMKVTTGKPPGASGSVVDLPPCDDFQLSVLKDKASEALLINGEEPVQVAELGTLLAAGVLCTSGFVASVGVRALKSKINHTEQEGVSVNWSGDTVSALFIATAPAVIGVIVAFPEFSLLTGLPVMGLCGLGAYHVAGYFGWELTSDDN